MARQAGEIEAIRAGVSVGQAHWDARHQVSKSPFQLEGFTFGDKWAKVFTQRCHTGTFTTSTFGPTVPAGALHRLLPGPFPLARPLALEIRYTSANGFGSGGFYVGVALG